MEVQGPAGLFLAVVAWLAAGLAGLNALAPYLGLKTVATWTMFSNLRVEGGRTNHMFIPVSIQIFPFLRDVCLVEQTDQPILANYWGKKDHVLSRKVSSWRAAISLGPQHLDHEIDEHRREDDDYIS